MAFRWRADDGSLIVVFIWILFTLKKALSKLDALCQNFLDPRMVYKAVYTMSLEAATYLPQAKHYHCTPHTSNDATSEHSIVGFRELEQQMSLVDY